MLGVTNVSKEFEGVRAVDGLSLELEKGSIFGLLGPNGAGKSTTIKMILQVLRPDSGSIFFDGRPMEEKDRERIGYLPEERGLYPKMRCGETLEYFAALKGIAAGAELHERIDYWLERFELSDYKNRKVEDLSKGMGQKLQFIITLLHDPDVLILDEPFSGLDPLSQNLLLEILSELKQQGRSILFSTHIMDHAEKICDRICILNKGKTLVNGSLSEVRRSRGNNSLILESDDAFPELEGRPEIARVVSYPRIRELTLAEGSDGQELVRQLMGGMRLNRFEFREPSLHAIYSELLGVKRDEQ